MICRPGSNTGAPSASDRSDGQAHQRSADAIRAFETGGRTTSQNDHSKHDQRKPEQREDFRLPGIDHGRHHESQCSDMADIGTPLE
jgi:hypothetical protein